MLQMKVVYPDYNIEESREYNRVLIIDMKTDKRTYFSEDSGIAKDIKKGFIEVKKERWYDNDEFLLEFFFDSKGNKIGFAFLDLVKEIEYDYQLTIHKE